MMSLKLRDGVFTADTDYGIALLDEHGNQYWTLNPSAALIVRTLLDGGTPGEAAQALTEEYKVDLDDASLDVQQLVDELCSAGLVEQEIEHPSGRRLPRIWTVRGRAR
jgi:hypothetical protein